MAHTLELLPTTACSTDQAAKWNGNAWECSTLSGGPAGAGATTMFLRIQPTNDTAQIVLGDSTDPDHLNEIVVLAYSNGRSNSGTTHTGGGGAGTANIRDLSFSAYAGRASPVLNQFDATGTILTKATLTIRTPYTTPTPSTFVHQKITLTNLLISSASGGGSGGGLRQTENYSINFSQIEMVYTPRDPKGVPRPEVRSCWNIQKASPC